MKIAPVTAAGSAMRYTPAAELKGFVKSFKDQSGLANNKDIAQTTKLLPKGSQWIFSSS